MENNGKHILIIIYTLLVRPLKHVKHASITNKVVII